MPRDEEPWNIRNEYVNRYKRMNHGMSARNTQKIEKDGASQSVGKNKYGN